MEVSRLLTAAAKAIARVRYCWLVTEAETGGVNARPMGRVLPSEVGRLWKDTYDSYVPSEADRANAAFVEVNVERMELWIRGVTQGLHATKLERDAVGTWRLSDRNAA